MAATLAPARRVPVSTVAALTLAAIVLPGPAAADHVAQWSFTNEYCTHPLLGHEFRSCRASGFGVLAVETCSASGCDFSMECGFGAIPTFPNGAGGGVAPGFVGDMTCTGVTSMHCVDATGASGCGDRDSGLLFVLRNSCPTGTTVFVTASVKTAFGMTPLLQHNFNACVDGNGVGHAGHA